MTTSLKIKSESLKKEPREQKLSSALKNNIKRRKMANILKEQKENK